MEEPEYVLNAGVKIKTHERLDSTSGFIIKQKYLDARRPCAEGVIKGYVAGHGGDVYWVEHADGTIAAYGWPEFELLEPGGQMRLPLEK